MNRPALVRALIVAALIGVAACSNPEAPSGDNGTTVNETTVNGQTLGLTIDGAAFEPRSVSVTNAPAIQSAPEALQILASGLISGSLPVRSVWIQVPNRVGTYDIRSAPYVVVIVQRIGSPEAYSEASNGLGSGTVEITSRTTTSAEGRLNVTLAPGGQGGGGGNTCAGTFLVRF